MVASDPMAEGRRTLRFSLRAFFISLVLISLGIAYRQRPFEMTIEMPAVSGKYYFGGNGDRGILEVDLPPRREVRTMQRLNLIGASQHGLTHVFDKQGTQIGTEWWNQDQRVRHEFVYRRADGTPHVKAKWQRGVPHGTWKWQFRNSENHTPQNWFAHDCVIYEATLIGTSGEQLILAWNGDSDPAIITPTKGQEQKIEVTLQRLKDGYKQIQGDAAYEMEFQNGQLTHVNGRTTGEFYKSLWRRLGECPIAEAVDIQQAFSTIVVCETRKRPLVLQEIFPKLKRRVNLEIDPLFTRLPVSFSGAELPVSASLYLMLRDREIAIDYRFGHLYVTTPDDAKNWSDQTGVHDLNFAPWKLDHVLDREVSSFEAFGRSRRIGAACRQFESMFNQHSDRGATVFSVEIAASLSNKSRMDLTANGSPVLSVRNMLGVFLDHHNLACRQNGSQIVIESETYQHLLP